MTRDQPSSLPARTWVWSGLVVGMAVLCCTDLPRRAVALDDALVLAMLVLSLLAAWALPFGSDRVPAAWIRRAPLCAPSGRMTPRLRLVSGRPEAGRRVRRLRLRGSLCQDSASCRSTPSVSPSA